MSIIIKKATSTVRVKNKDGTGVPKVEVRAFGVQGVRGIAGQGGDRAQTSYYLFERAGEMEKDDNLFPTLIVKGDYEGVTNATRVINRNVDNNLIVDSVVDTYDFDDSRFVWTTPYLGGTDLLANRPSTPSVVVT